LEYKPRKSTHINVKEEMRKSNAYSMKEAQRVAELGRALIQKPVSLVEFLKQYKNAIKQIYAKPRSAPSFTNENV